MANKFKTKKKPTDKEGKFTGKVTQEVIRILEDCFSNHATTEQACLHAGINKATFYRYLKRNPCFASRIELLRSDISYKAKKALIRAVESSDPFIAMKAATWLLERLEPLEYSAKKDNPIDINIKIGDIEKENIKKVIDVTNSKVAENETIDNIITKISYGTEA